MWRNLKYVMSFHMVYSDLAENSWVRILEETSECNSTVGMCYRPQFRLKHALNYLGISRDDQLILWGSWTSTTSARISIWRKGAVKDISRVCEKQFLDPDTWASWGWTQETVLVTRKQFFEYVVINRSLGCTKQGRMKLKICRQSCFLQKMSKTVEGLSTVY